MEVAENGIYVGIDINAKYTMISYYQLNMDEPQTISTVMGSENYQIPTAIAKRKGVAQWYFGDEARLRARCGEAEIVEDLLEKALLNQEFYIEHEKISARDLLAIFFKKLFSVSGVAYAKWPIKKVVITLDTVNVAYMELFSIVFSKLEIEPDKILLLDHRETFYYYALNQRPELFYHDVAMFEFSQGDMISCILQRNQSTTPQMIHLMQSNQGKLFDNLDEQFLLIAKEELDEHNISAIYLVGDGFDGDWMKASLQYLCKKGKVFVGKNLYSKGACFAGVIKDKQMEWPFAYIGENELKINLYIKVIDQNELQLYTLLSAGESWFESKGECEVILDGSAEVEFYIQKPESREAHMELLELSDLPIKENRTVRLRISATPKSDKEVVLEIKDLGFGEIFPSSGKSWTHRMILE